MGEITFYGLGGLGVLVVGFCALQEAIAHFTRGERWRGAQRTITGVSCLILGIGGIAGAAFRIAYVGH